MAHELTSPYLLRAYLNLRTMLRGARIGGLPPERLDLGYLVHWHLVRLLQEVKLMSFSVRGQRQEWVEILAYIDKDASELATRMPMRDSDRICDWSTIATKRLPQTWVPGVVLRFETRVCPVVRRAKDGRHHRRGAEVDAFLVACEDGEPVSRADVYRSWLARQFSRDDAAELVHFAPVAVTRARLHRRSQGTKREGNTLLRPSLLAVGSIEITNATAFGNLIRRGIGRHRAFGFGMILLKR